MNKTIQRITRVIILSLLLRNVYSESGIWTVAALALIFATMELQSYMMVRWSNEIQSIILSAREPKPRDGGGKA